MPAQTISEPQGPTGAQRARLDGTPVTLNGNPATIRNAPGAFAVIVCDVTGARESFGWVTASRILATGGQFVTLGTHWPPAPPVADDRRLPPGYADLYARR